MRAYGLLRVGIALICGAAVLGACTSERVSPSLQPSTLDQARSPEQNAELYTDLIRKLIDEDRVYAALAHLQAREQQFGRTDELRLLRADILRKMNNNSAAAELYTQLRDTRFAGQADHGLGLIYAQDNLERGATYLEQAVAKVPTDARMRNDLGYARLRQGRIAEAQVQLATAYQLDDKNQLNRNNYILLLLVQGNNRRAQAIATRSQITSQAMQDLREQAKRLAAGATSPPTRSGATRSTPLAASGPLPARQSRPAVSGQVGGGGG